MPRDQMPRKRPPGGHVVRTEWRESGIYYARLPGPCSAACLGRTAPWVDATMADMEQQPQTTKRRRVVADSAAPDLAGLNPAVARAMAGGDAATDAAVSRLAEAFRARTDCDESATVGIVVNGTPFPTCTIDGLLNPALLDRVQVRRRTSAREAIWQLTHGRYVAISAVLCEDGAPGPATPAEVQRPVPL